MLLIWFLNILVFISEINERTQAGCIGEQGVESSAGANSAEQTGD